MFFKNIDIFSYSQYPLCRTRFLHSRRRNRCLLWPCASATAISTARQSTIDSTIVRSSPTGRLLGSPAISSKNSLLVFQGKNLRKFAVEVIFFSGHSKLLYAKTWSRLLTFPQEKFLFILFRWLKRSGCNGGVMSW